MRPRGNRRRNGRKDEAGEEGRGGSVFHPAGVWSSLAPCGTVFPISSPLIKRENKDMHVIKKPDPSKQGSKERMGRNK